MYNTCHFSWLPLPPLCYSTNSELCSPGEAWKSSERQKCPVLPLRWHLTQDQTFTRRWPTPVSAVGLLCHELPGQARALTLRVHVSVGRPGWPRCSRTMCGVGQVPSILRPQDLTPFGQATFLCPSNNQLPTPSLLHPPPCGLGLPGNVTSHLLSPLTLKHRRDVSREQTPKEMTKICVSFLLLLSQITTTWWFKTTRMYFLKVL